MAELPCDADGICMVCKTLPPDGHVLICNGCASPWHMQCLNPPLTEPPTGDWNCPDCSLPLVNDTAKATSAAAVPAENGSLVAQIRAIEADATLTDEEKAKKRQELLMAKNNSSRVDDDEDEKKPKQNKLLSMLDERLICGICMQVLERPVTTTCSHNFCLKCFTRWTRTTKTCAKCRSNLPHSLIAQPRINSVIVMFIREAKAAAESNTTIKLPKVYNNIRKEAKPDKAFMTDRAKRKGLSNAASGRIFVNIPSDHFGPILAENDPEKNRGVCVGDSWNDRMECRQWGAHFPHVAGIAGQSEYGSQSVALSGGYLDDEDNGEWFLYTGSGGRDLSGNKRTNKDQSFDQKFEKANEALRVSCMMGYPVRVVRSHKEKRSSYAPEIGIRYDGVYRIEKCWRKEGIQGFKVCRYLFVRCDNDPAPWTSDECGDKPRALPDIPELQKATDITERKQPPAWDYKDGKWGWTRDPPRSRMTESKRKPRERTPMIVAETLEQKLLKGFGCDHCHKVLTQPLSTPCGHNFCKPCIEGLFAGIKDVRERSRVGGRSLRAQKVVKKCPACESNITEFLSNPQVNRQMEDIIQGIKNEAENKPDSNDETVVMQKTDNLENLDLSNEEAGDADEEHDPKVEPGASSQSSDGLRVGDSEGPESNACTRNTLQDKEKFEESDMGINTTEAQSILVAEVSQDLQTKLQDNKSHSADKVVATENHSNDKVVDQSEDTTEPKKRRAKPRGIAKAGTAKKNKKQNTSVTASVSSENEHPLEDEDVPSAKGNDSSTPTQTESVEKNDLSLKKRKIESSELTDSKDDAKMKVYSSKRTKKEVVTPLRTYRTRAKIASDSKQTESQSLDKNKTSSEQDRSSPKTPLIIESDSDFE